MGQAYRNIESADDLQYFVSSESGLEKEFVTNDTGDSGTTSADAAIKLDTTASIWVRWNEVPLAEDTEVLVRMRTTQNFSINHGVVVRGQGQFGSTTASGYHLNIRGTIGFRDFRTVNNTETHFQAANVVNLTSTLEYNLLRVRAEGSTIRFKAWETGATEPDWQRTRTNTDVTGTGLVGLFLRGISASLLVDWIGAGWDGDPAPTGPVGVSEEPFQLRHNPRTNKVIPVLSSPTVTDIGANCVRPRVSKGY